MLAGHYKKGRRYLSGSSLVRVNLQEWMRSNRVYVAAWILMGLATLGLIVRELGIYTLILILPFLPLLAISLVRMAQELKK